MNNKKTPKNNLTLKKESPLPPSWPVVGHLPFFIKNPFEFFENTRKKYGHIYNLRFGPVEMTMLNLPEYAHHVLRENVVNYRKGGAMFDSIRTLLGNGLFVSEGDFWLRQRRMVQPHFHKRHFEVFVDLMVETITYNLAYWDDYISLSQGFDISQTVTSITVQVIVKTIFGSELGIEEINKVADDFTFAIDYQLMGMITNRLPEWCPAPGRQRYKKAVQTIDEIVFDVINRRRLHHNERTDLISMLVEMVDFDSGEQMTDKQLRDEAVTMFLAGYETTAITLGWVIHFLTQYPDVLKKVKAEVDEVLAEHQPTFEDVPKLVYTRMVIQETLRIRPVAWMLPRLAIEDDEIDGFHIPAGSTVALSIYNIHHDPDIWENPDEFRPERFTPENISKQHGLAWLPFGGGQRICLGKEFALVEAQLAIAMILQKYHFVAIPEKIAKTQMMASVKPKGGVWVNLEKR